MFKRAYKNDWITSYIVKGKKISKKKFKNCLEIANLRFYYLTDTTRISQYYSLPELNKSY